MPSTVLPVPSGGWNTFDPPASMKASFAHVLDNWRVVGGKLEVRPGYRVWASGLPGRVAGLLPFQRGAVRSLFAVSGGGIYDVTGPGPVGLPVVQGLSAAPMDCLLIAAAGGQFLLAFNGQDQEWTYNGTAWAPWTATGLPGPIAWGTVFKGVPVVGRPDRLSFFHLIPGAIGGAATEFPLQGVARLGGGVAGASTWTLDGGNGPDDYLALFTTEGEVIVYKGENPSDATTFGLVGVFRMPRPIGSRFVRQVGGDVLVLTEGGVFTLGQLVGGTEAAALAPKARTRLIEPTFLALAHERRAQQGWDLVPLPAQGMWLVNLPWGGQDAQQLAFGAAANTASRFTGLPASCWVDAAGRAFFGHAKDGKVLLWGEDTSDVGAPIAAECVQAFSTFGASGALKRFTIAEPVLVDAAGAAVKIEMALDWQVPEPEAIVAGAGAPPIASLPPKGVMVWGTGTWGLDKWAGGSGAVRRGWRGVRGTGQAGAVRLRVVAQYTRLGWISTGLVWEQGGPLR